MCFLLRLLFYEETNIKDFMKIFFHIEFCFFPESCCLCVGLIFGKNSSICVYNLLKKGSGTH